MTKKIAILSDTHGYIHPDIVDLVSKCDIAIHAGDICEEQTLTQLKPQEKLIAIQGNNDYHITHLKDKEELNLFNRKIVVEHGHAYPYEHIKSLHNSLREQYPDANIIIYGHTHKQVIDDSQTPWVINPGAAGKIRTYGGASCLVLQLAEDKKCSIEKFRFND